jgi:hypothetical protein
MPMPRLRPPSPLRVAARAACAGGLALAAACADLPTAAQTGALASAPARSTMAASGFTGGFDLVETSCEWDLNSLAQCAFRVVGIGGVPAGAILTVRLDHRFDMTYRCQNVRNGRLGRTLTLTNQVASIGGEYPGERTEIVSTLGTVPVAPVNACKRSEVLAEAVYTPRQATLLFGYRLDGRFVVNSASAFEPTP